MLPSSSIPVALPAHADRLVLLFHGVGSQPAAMVPLGERIARALAAAAVVAVAGPQPSGTAGGREWFSVAGVTDANRPGRVAEALPTLLDAVAEWQRRTGVAAEATVLVGFSQGAIMALATLARADAPARTVVAIAGRLAEPPAQVAPATTVHVLHGEADPVMPIGLAEAAVARLAQLGARVSFDRFPGLGHGISEALAAGLVARLLGDGAPAGEVGSVSALAIRLEAEQAIVSRPAAQGGEEVRSLALGPATLVRRCLHHTPPTAGELEAAIDLIEPQIMALGLHLPAGAVLRLSGDWPADLQRPAPGLHRDAVEGLFSRLAAIAHGRPAASEGLPADPAYFAAALLLRELLHHLGAVRAEAAAPAQGGGPQRSANTVTPAGPEPLKKADT